MKSERNSTSPDADANDSVRQDSAAANSPTSEFAADMTMSAPSFPRELPPKEQRAPANLAEILLAGAIVDDFEILALLGRGAAGVVYLARQRSLDRRVALKITDDIGSEARTMATLEHPHIVPVFSETIQIEHRRRLLCMQYVPGVTLAELVRRLRNVPTANRSGRMLLEAIDAATQGELAFDADALRGRELLEHSDYVQAVCWIVARLAEALHFAHRRGVLHRDIKPANILIDPYGRPRLADFSLAEQTALSDDQRGAVFGGTIAYMAPEHLDAFHSHSATDVAAVDVAVVDERSDIYSLGVVLYELLAFRLPHDTISAGQRLDGPTLEKLAHQRRSPNVGLRHSDAAIPLALETAIARCLAAEPHDRYQDAGQLAAALDGCRRLTIAVEQLPPAGPITRVMERWHLVAVIPLTFLPHLLGNLFTPAYNFLVLFPRLEAAQKTALILTSAGYGAVVFPLHAAIVVLLFGRSVRMWCAVKRGDSVSSQDVEWARKRLLAAPATAVVMALLGWGPLLMVVPGCLFASGAGMNWSEFGHFLISIVLSLLVAAIYTFLILQYSIVRVFYPRAWADATNFVAVTRLELAHIPLRVRWSQSGTGLAPLFGAVLIVAVGPDAFEAGGYFAFQLLIVALIVFGMCGIPLAIHLGGLIQRSIDALTDSVHPHGRRDR